MIIQVCVGSSCHLNGSQAVVELLQKNLEAYHLNGCVQLKGAFCIGKCNRDGVTVQVDEAIVSGVNSTNFDAFFKEFVLNRLAAEGSV